MDNGPVYFCEDCERVLPLTKVKGNEVPECCGRPMIKVSLDFCSKPPASAEHARMDDEDQPCRTE